jgi:hypothetical protein
MGEKHVSKSQPEIIKKLEYLQKRFEIQEKKLQEPWRKCDNEYKEWVQNIINKLTNHIRIVRKGKSTGSPKIDLLQIEQIERSIGINLMMQNLLKSSDREVSPFGEEHDLSHVFSK